MHFSEVNAGKAQRTQKEPSISRAGLHELCRLTSLADEADCSSAICTNPKPRLASAVQRHDWAGCLSGIRKYTKEQVRAPGSDAGTSADEALTVAGVIKYCSMQNRPERLKHLPQQLVIDGLHLCIDHDVLEARQVVHDREELVHTSTVRTSCPHSPGTSCQHTACKNLEGHRLGVFVQEGLQEELSCRANHGVLRQGQHDMKQKQVSLACKPANNRRRQ